MDYRPNMVEIGEVAEAAAEAWILSQKLAYVQEGSTPRQAERQAKADFNEKFDSMDVD